MPPPSLRGFEAAACGKCGGGGVERLLGPAAASTHRRYPSAGGAEPDSRAPATRLGPNNARTGVRRINLPPNSHEDRWSRAVAATGVIALALERNFPRTAREAALSAQPVRGKGRRRPADPDLGLPGERAAVPPRRRVRGERPG